MKRQLSTPNCRLSAGPTTPRLPAGPTAPRLSVRATATKPSGAASPRGTGLHTRPLLNTASKALRKPLLSTVPKPQKPLSVCLPKPLVVLKNQASGKQRSSTGARVITGPWSVSSPWSSVPRASLLKPRHGRSNSCLERGQNLVSQPGGFYVCCFCSWNPSYLIY